jgi:hypothetical protein
MKWSISPGLPGVFGARFVLKIWFPMQQPGANSSSGNARSGSSEGSSDALPVRYQLLPNGSMDSNTTSIAFDPAVGSFLVQPIAEAQAIVYVAQPTRTDNINQQQDYSFNNTPVIGTANATTTGSSNSSNSTSRVIIRHAVQANTQMPAFLDNELAWGSPPTSRQVCTAGTAVSPVLWLPLLCCFCLSGQYAAVPCLRGSATTQMLGACITPVCSGCLLQVTINASSPAGSSGSGSRGFNSSLPPGSYCTWSEQNHALSCGIDVTYCCLGSYNLGGIPQDWKQRLVVDQRVPNATRNTTDAVVNQTAGLVLPVNSNSSGGGSNIGAADSIRPSPTKAYVVALSVALAVLAVLFAVAIVALLRWMRREVSRRTSSVQESAASGGDGGGIALLGFNNPQSPASSPPTSSDPSAVLLLPSSKLATVPLLAPAGPGDRTSSSGSNMQSVLDRAASGASAFSPFAQPSWQEQLESQQQLDPEACKAAAAAAAAAVATDGARLDPFAGSSGSHAHSLVSLWLMRGRTMPADLLAHAVDQFHAAQQQAQVEGPADAAAAGKMSSNSPEPPDPPLKR